jgi:hypothetical protein
MNHKLDRITEAYISKSEADATKALQLALASESDDEALKLTGLEVLAFIGLKIALPILTSFAKDAIYNKYKAIKTKKEAEAAKVELLGPSIRPSKVAKEIASLTYQKSSPKVSPTKPSHRRNTLQSC